MVCELVHNFLSLPLRLVVVKIILLFSIFSEDRVIEIYRALVGHSRGQVVVK